MQRPEEVNLSALPISADSSSDMTLILAYSCLFPFPGWLLSAGAEPGRPLLRVGSKLGGEVGQRHIHEGWRCFFMHFGVNVRRLYASGPSPP